LQPKVLDFGIAKLEQSTDSSTRLTQDGAVLGSPGYFSPEQARGETNIDSRTDIWSISVVLYELITGELPFSGPNYNALLMSILKDNPKPITSYGYGDEELWRILQRGLHRDRERRWPSMWELGRALAKWLFDKGARADVTSRSLEEVWLEPRPSEQAPPVAEAPREGGRRRVLSTLIKRRSADTLAGETISTMNAQRLVATRVLGWGAAAAGVLALSWTVLAQTAPSASVTHAAAAIAPERGVALPPVAPPATAMLADTVNEPIATAMRSEPKAKKPQPSGEVRAALSNNTALDPGKTRRSAPTRPGPLAKPATGTTKPTPSATKPSGPRKRIDQEFGF
jgi:serine/threonine-protein kinase